VKTSEIMKHFMGEAQIPVENHIQLKYFYHLASLDVILPTALDIHLIYISFVLSVYL